MNSKTPYSVFLPNSHTVLFKGGVVICFSMFTAPTLDAWLSHLEQQHPKAIDLGLGRIRPVAEALQLTDLGCPVITVGGTNGKGSTVTLLTAIYVAEGYRVGTYTSPHILRFNERIAVNQQPALDQDLVTAFAAIEQARADLQISLTYFEFTTLAAFWLFKQAALDVVILEVGLGGRLDAVNLIDADVAVVTSIGLDHVDWLGTTREAISYEKAGIFRANKPAVYGEIDPPQPLLDHATHISTPLHIKGRDFGWRDEGQTWSWQGLGQTWTQLSKPRLALENAATALAAIALAPLTVSSAALQQGLQHAQLAGRAQRFEKNGVEIVLDVAHNPHGATFFMQQLPTISGRTHAVFAMLADKDQASTLDACLGRIDRWHVAGLDVPRGCSAEHLMPLLLERGMCVAGSYTQVANALAVACQQALAGDRIVVFGSFYTVAAAQQWLTKTYGYSN